MTVSLIAAIDRQNGIGKDNQLLCYLPNDLRYFKKVTMGKPIVMGYNTFRSIGKALPGRKNVVLTSKQGLSVAGVDFVSQIDEALELCSGAFEIMVIGGESLYKQMLPQADKLYLTLIEHTFDADVFFPKVDFDQWHKVSEESHPVATDSPFAYSFQVFEKVTLKR